MATMIPQLIRAGSPNGEVAVFEALRDHPGTADWLVWHGLPIRHHATQVQGEADFVVVVPGEGVLVIEVKSHDRVEVGADGLWHLGGNAPTSRSPYTQADDNARSIRHWVEQRAYRLPYPVWQAVWFPNRGGELAAQLEARIDVPAKATLTRADLDASRLITSIVGVLRHGRSELERREVRYLADRPDEQDIAELRQVLQPTVTFHQAMAERRERRERDLREATERQEAALQYFGAHRQLLVTGPAGTGKTNVAVRAALQAANRDERVLLTCFNRELEADLRHRLRDRDDLTIARVHQLMLAYSGLTPPPDAGDEWWNGTLPAATLTVTRAPGFMPPFDCLVADEAQDLARESTLDVLDSLLVGGLAGARAILAGDFSRQDIYRPAEPGSSRGSGPDDQPSGATPLALTRQAAIDARLTAPATMTLTANVRQTPQLAEFVELALGDVEYSDYLRDDDAPAAEGPASVHRYASPDEQQALLTAALAQLWEEGWEPRDILVLSPRRESAAKRLFGAGADASPSQAQPEGLRWGTIHRYKGMESPVVVVTDIDGTGSGWHDLLYVGMTRATERLVVLTSLDTLAAPEP